MALVQNLTACNDLVEIIGEIGLNISSWYALKPKSGNGNEYCELGSYTGTKQLIIKQTRMESNQFGKEAVITEAIEKGASKIPSDILLWASVGSMAVSVFLRMTGRKRASRFIWQLTAPFLITGLYGKLAKAGAFDAETNGRQSN
jgi:hypothetical protein